MSSDEVERLKERTKVNFFQVEKRLAEDDIRMDGLEKSIKEIKDLKKSLEKSERQQPENLGAVNSQISSISNSIKGIEAEIRQIRDNLQ